MAYDTAWSDDRTLSDARDALVKSKGFSAKEAEQAIVGLVEAGFLIRTKTSARQGEPYPDFSDKTYPPKGHLLPAAPQDMQVRDWPSAGIAYSGGVADSTDEAVRLIKGPIRVVEVSLLAAHPDPSKGIYPIISAERVVEGDS